MSILRQFIQETEAMAATELANNVVSFREARAARIKELAAQWAENTIQLGRELKAVQETFPIREIRGAAWSRPDWKEWLKVEVGISESHSKRLIRIADKFGARGAVAVASGRVLELLSANHVPEEAREQVIQRIESGETIGRGRAKSIVDAVKADAPSPEKAREIARETGVPQLARDGNIYLGATKEQETATEARREMVFGVRHAIEALANVGVTPDSFLKQALPHQLWNVKEEHLIGQALDWLTDLAAAWGRR